MKLCHVKYVAIFACILHFSCALAAAEGDKLAVLVQGGQVNTPKNNQGTQEGGKLLVVVQDLQQRPVSGLKIGIEGGGNSLITGEDGKVVLTLAGNTKENDWVSFQIVECPPGKDLVIIAPANHRHLVPSFNGKAENFVTIIVIPRDIYLALVARPKMRESTTRIQSPQRNDRKGGK